MTNNNLFFETLNLLRYYNIRLGKKKGQHFIVNSSLLKREIEYSELTPSDTVLEIGAGLGALTLALAEKAKRVFAIEKDQNLLSVLKDKFSSFNNIEIISGDALKLEFPPVQKIVSNIPYSISSPLTFKILSSRYEKAILTYQLEFAERLIANPGSKNYGRITVGVYYKAEAKLLETIPRTAFYPPPKVESAIIMLKPKPPPFEILNEEVFFEVVRFLFMHPNKKAKHGIKSYIKNKKNKYFKFTKMESFPEIFEKRVRNLTPEEIKEIANILIALENS
ncbi:MAG: 16S rRNA (adenine(1518)-N(6)/adenine(1519)-N(6))-dimethyltransferase RsmA [Candidatus Jordarchaeum sp.]|uniref:16S rRNA (adenine(1518)-N(6)/adenine(1519)-N(6))- dimethyltransferase RsmA n=1 Tax=Candidatus Jordarchaeum sp. TaxID=2823881 RepID=UPI004049F735